MLDGGGVTRPIGCGCDRSTPTSCMDSTPLRLLVQIFLGGDRGEACLRGLSVNYYTKTFHQEAPVGRCWYNYCIVTTVIS